MGSVVPPNGLRGSAWVLGFGWCSDGVSVESACKSAPFVLAPKRSLGSVACVAEATTDRKECNEGRRRN